MHLNLLIFRENSHYSSSFINSKYISSIIIIPEFVNRVLQKISDLLLFPFNNHLFNEKSELSNIIIMNTRITNMEVRK